MFDIFTSVCTGWAKLNDACYHRRQFLPGPWVLQDPTTFEAWSGPNIGDPLSRPDFGNVKKSVTDVSAMSPGMLVIGFHFSPLKRQSDLLCGPYGGLTLHVVYFYLLIEVRCIKSKDRNDILQSFG